ncbi:hypothetical protein ACVME8_006086 [Bradyrhizobium diazoefficiens]
MASGRAHATSRIPSEDVRGRRSRVVLTPGVCASSLAVMLRSDRTRASAIREATGAIVHRSPGRARRTPLKPFAQGRPGDPARPVVHPVCIFCGARTCGCQPAPGLPCALVSTRAREKQNSGDIRREKAMACLLFETCIGTTASLAPLSLSSPAKAGDPVLRGGHCANPLVPRSTGCLAFAGHDTCIVTTTASSSARSLPRSPPS